jgi:hypothetical protein
VIRVAPLLLGVALVAASCGSSARDDLGKTTHNVGKIRAGTISFALVVHPRTKLAKTPFGFRLHGPFAFGDRPTAHVDYTQIANGREATATLVLTRGGGYAVANGKRRALSADDLASLRAAASSAREGGSVDVSDWVTSARRCGERCVTGGLDGGEAVKTLLQYTNPGAELSDDEQRQIADATRATYRVHWTDGHLLRDLTVHADLALRAPARLRAALGDLVGARVDLHVAIAHASG